MQTQASGFGKRAKIGLSLTTGVVTSLFGSSPAWADAPPPTQFVVDNNGVNLARGTYSLRVPEVSIGSGRSALVAYSTRLTGSDPDNELELGAYGGGSVELDLAVLGPNGPTSEAFTQSGSTFTSKLNDGSTVTLANGIYTLTTANGTQYIYDTYYTSNDSNRTARATKIKYPSGETLTVSYLRTSTCTSPYQQQCAGSTIPFVVRVQDVVSSFGYQLHYDYASNNASDPTWNTVTKITAFNMAVDVCGPNQPTCTFSRAWPSVTYGKSQSATGTIWTVTDALNRTTTFSSSSVRRPTSTVDDIVKTATATGFNLNIDGRVWQYSFSVSGVLRTAVITNPDGSSRTVVSNYVVGLPTSVTDELTHTTTYTYDSAGHVTSATQPDGQQVTYLYDARGNATQVTHISKTPGTPANTVTSSTYATTCTNVVTCNKPVTSTDENGNITHYAYDPVHGGVTSITRPIPASGAVAPQARFSYTPLQAYYKYATSSVVASGVQTYMLTGVSSCQTTANCTGAADEAKQTISYGPQTSGVSNNLLPVSVSMGSGDGALVATTASVYDDVGNNTYVDGPLPGSADSSRKIYDAGRQLVGLIGPDPDGSGPLVNRAARITYNADGQVTKMERGTTTGQDDNAWAAFSPKQAIVTSYDKSGLKNSESQTSGSATYSLTQYSYDANGRQSCAALRMNPSAFGSAPDACTLGTPGSAGPDRISQIVYDAADHVTQQLSAVNTPDASTDATYTYSKNGQIASLTDAQGNRTSYFYDGLDRLAQVQYPVAAAGSRASNVGDYETVDYDPAGNITGRRLRDGQSITYTYDALSRVKTKTMPSSEPSFSYGYDNLGRLLSATLLPPAGYGQAGSSSTYTYDALGRVLTEAGQAGTIGSQYDLAGHRTRMTWLRDGLFVNYDYLLTGDISAIRENGAAAGAGLLATYGYDNIGRRTRVTRGNGTSSTYTYDQISGLASLSHDLSGTANDITLSLSRLPSSQIGSVSRSNDQYSFNGLYNVDRAYSVNGLNELTTAGALSQTFDARGNIISSGADIYTYTAENLLVTAPNSVHLYYDALGRLSQVDAGASTAFVYDGANRVSEDYGGVYARRYVYAPGADEPILWYEGSGTADRRWLHADERGSVIAVSDGSGAALAINRYDEYGIPASTNLGVFGYTGQAWLSAVGMNYYKARIYSPTLGRFLQTDPIGYQNGPNWYNYVGSDPVNLTDPTGTQDAGATIFVTGVLSGGSGTFLPSSLSDSLASNGYTLPNPNRNDDPGEAAAVRRWLGYNPKDSAPRQNDIVVTARRSCGLFCRIGRFLSGHPIVSGVAIAGVQFIPGVDGVVDAGLAVEGAEVFTAEGALTEEAIAGSREIIPSAKIGNPNVPSGLSKYTTQTFPTPSGTAQARFYMNPQTGEVFYGVDYKTIFTRGIGGP